MILYLYGPDSYRRQQKLKESALKYKEKYSNLTLDHFYLGEEDDFLRFKDFALNQSLFGDFKLGILHDLDSAANQKELITFIKLFLKSKKAHLIISEGKELGKEFGFLLKKPALSQEFKALTKSSLVNLIKAEAKKRKVALDDKTLWYLINVSQEDTWALINELDRLSLGGKIELLYEYSKNDFFNLVTKIPGASSVAMRLKIFEILLDNEELAMIFNFIAAFARGKEKLKMANYDAMIKSGKLNYEEALLDLTISQI